MAKYTYGSSKGRLGSFEGLGKSRLGSHVFGDFAGTAQEYLQQVQADLGRVPSLMTPQMMNIPRNDWQYWEFRGKPPIWVQSNAPVYIQRYAGRVSTEAQPTQQQDTGPSAGEVLTGVGTIVGALANPLAQIFATTQQARLEKERLKHGGGAPAGDPNAALYAMLASRNQGGGGSTTTIVIVIVALVVVGGLIFALKG